MIPASHSGLDWLRFAREVIASTAAGTDPLRVPEPPGDAPHAGVFVTLHRGGRLRGCMGILDGTLSLAEAVRQAATCAAAHDPRFQRVAPDELHDLVIEISVLSPPVPMRSPADLELGCHGILVRQGQRRGLYLPQVAIEHRLTREEFLSHCCREKAGLAADAWRQPETEVLLFTTLVLREAHDR